MRPGSYGMLEEEESQVPLMQTPTMLWLKLVFNQLK